MGDVQQWVCWQSSRRLCADCGVLRGSYPSGSSCCEMNGYNLGLVVLERHMLL
jgi:hypothetical protein